MPNREFLCGRGGGRGWEESPRLAVRRTVDAAKPWILLRLVEARRAGRTVGFGRGRGAGTAAAGRSGRGKTVDSFAARGGPQGGQNRGLRPRPRGGEN